MRLTLRHSITMLSIVMSTSCAPEHRATPETPDWLLDRAKEQRVLAVNSPVFQDFQFRDERTKSGITFVNHVVDDASRSYKKVHYDHGSGVCAADVDGDGLIDVYFVSQLGKSELWRNVGGGAFHDATADAGLALPDLVGVGCSFADIDNDGRPDLFVTTVRHGNRLFHNAGSGKFTDITATAGVAYTGHSSGAVFLDYDGDGLLDLFVANVGIYTSEERGAGGYFIGLTDAFHGHTHPERAETSILYHNLGGLRFEDVTHTTGLVDNSWSGDAVVIDANDDGRPDLYVLDMQGENHLWLNERGAHFRDASKEFFPRTPWGAMGAKVFDFDGDGRLDLFVTDMHSDMFTDLAAGDWISEALKSDPSKMPDDLFPSGKSHLIFGNALYRNGAAADSNRFKDVSDRLGVETYWPWGPSVDDTNADGWDDAFVVGSMNFPYRYSTNSMLLNEHGKHFTHAEFTLGIEPHAGGETEQEWMHLDCAGIDRGNTSCTVCTQANAQAMGCRGDAHGKLTVLGPRGSRSAVIFDVDGDGDLDIITNDFNGPPQVLVSTLAQGKGLHYVKVHLKGSRSNRQGLGALVTAVLPDHRHITKVMDGKSGYLSQSDLPLYFGLGDADHLESLEVQWPSGAHQSATGPLQSARTVEVVEP
ncbi:MAG: CRTAC1 family protein [bacterium]